MQFLTEFQNKNKSHAMTTTRIINKKQYKTTKNPKK